jgi:GNAT superfamily N-acetyltransferase
MPVEDVGVEATFDLRARVLREGVRDPDVRFASDDDPSALHLAICDEDRRPLAVVSALPAATDLRPGRRAWQLRGMAVEPALQGRGIGAQLLDAVVERCRAAGAEVVWADGRDSALGFYCRHGWTVEGDGYDKVGIPHHTVVLDLPRQGAR